MIDSHCHLDGKAFDDDRDAVVERALEAGVSRMVVIGTGEGPLEGLEAGIRMAEKYPHCCLATTGIHPHDASKAGAEAFVRLRELVKHPAIVALGEIGLDYHYDFSPREVQQQVFIRQLEIAAEAGLAITLHTREAWADTFEILDKHWPAGRPGVFHCFTGAPNEMRKCVERGFWLGIGGVVTFPRSETLRDAVREAPADRLIVETDAPYLAPVPHRGKRCEPAHVMETARKVAEVRGMTLEEVDVLTSANFERLIDRLH